MLTDRELKHRLEKKKSEYSGFLGDIIQENPYNRTLNQRLPKAVRAAFCLMTEWLDTDQEVPVTSTESDANGAH